MTSIFHFPSAFEGGGLSNKKFTILVKFFLFLIVDSLSSLKTPEKACFKSFLHRRQILEKKQAKKESPLPLPPKSATVCNCSAKSRDFSSSRSTILQLVSSTSITSAQLYLRNTDFKVGHFTNFSICVFIIKRQSYA